MIQAGGFDWHVLEPVGVIGGVLVSIWSVQLAQRGEKRNQEQEKRNQELTQSAKDLKTEMALEAFRVKDEIRKEFASIPWVKEIEYQLNHRVIRSIETSLFALKATLDRSSDQSQNQRIVQLLEEIKLEIEDMRRKEQQDFMNRFEGKK